jgi:hypothetical protein
VSFILYDKYMLLESGRAKLVLVGDIILSVLVSRLMKEEP